MTVEQGDIAALRANLSKATIGFLREKLGKQKVDAGVAFMMRRLQPEIPLQIVSQRHVNGNVLLKVQGGQQIESLGGELKFIREGGVWKLDLVEDFQAWEYLGEMVNAIEENMRRATPLLDDGVRRGNEPNRTNVFRSIPSVDTARSGFSPGGHSCKAGSQSTPESARGTSRRSR